MNKEKGEGKVEFGKPEIRVLDVTALEEPSEFEKAYLSVDSDRRAKVDSLKPLNDKRLSLGVGWLLKKSLCEFGVKNFLLRYGEAGKPYLENRKDLFFSLSHSGKYAVGAFWKNEIGVDIQEISEHSEKVIRRVTTDREFEYLSNLDANMKSEVFTRLWTAKESFLKLLGKGFSISPKDLEVELQGELSVSLSGKKQEVKFEEYPLSGYKLTICY